MRVSSGNARADQIGPVAMCSSGEPDWVPTQQGREPYALLTPFTLADRVAFLEDRISVLTDRLSATTRERDILAEEVVTLKQLVEVEDQLLERKGVVL